MSWGMFVEEIWSRFRPIDCEDFDELLSNKWGPYETIKRNLKG